MESFCKVTISLSANAGMGRYTLKYKEFKVIKDTPKTVTVQKNFGPHRYMKVDSMKAHSERRNEKLGLLQFFTTCDKKDLDDAVKLLKTTLEERASELVRENVLALEALKGDCKLQKITT